MISQEIIKYRTSDTGCCPLHYDNAKEQKRRTIDYGGHLVSSSSLLLWLFGLPVMILLHSVNAFTISTSRGGHMGLSNKRERIMKYQQQHLSKTNRLYLTKNLLDNLFNQINPMLPRKDNKQSNIENLKLQILQNIEPTSNGKTATKEQQITILQLVRQLELLSPPPTNLFQDNTCVNNINGTWYLQYTSPSSININDDNIPTKIDDDWMPIDAKEGISNIETQPFNAKGTVSAAGIPVDAANKLVEQNINAFQRTVVNCIEFKWGTIIVSGTFKQSNTVPNRAIVAFDTAKIRIGKNDNIIIDLSFLFTVAAIIRQSNDNGWLETTYLDSSMRIGRGNKGTMFVLTK